MSAESWLPAWFHLPLRVDVATGHHLRPQQASDGPSQQGDASSIRYVLLDDEERSVLGWVDIRPSIVHGYDAEVSWGVADHLRGSDVEGAVSMMVPSWIRRDWPFAEVRSGA